ncbi:tetraspanin family protein [Nocardioides zhouii]|uniref:Uncharacterized protein n=1 Tax=Nocardioides zhouii TaxID=1168729 RepID=A0A4Q2SWW2_9ACTN|nr:tetraspanin family protein [Nocardioides zhouii]RYC10605.1 hypothetical protein EUA94_12500 [Nocardioides zhouii]
MSSTTLAPARGITTTKQKVGIAIAGVYSLTNIPGFLTAPDPGVEGPPMAILVVGSILGVIGLVASVLAWRGNRVALRVAAGSMIVITLTGLPAFFVDVPMFIKALVGFSVLLTVLAVVLMFSTDRRPVPVSTEVGAR